MAATPRNSISSCWGLRLIHSTRCRRRLPVTDETCIKPGTDLNHFASRLHTMATTATEAGRGKSSKNINLRGTEYSRFTLKTHYSRTTANF